MSTRFFHQLTLCILAMTITVQGLAAVAKICPTAGNLSQVVSNLSNHLVHAHHTQAIGAEGTALMALSGHGLHSLNTDAPLGENGSESLSHIMMPQKKVPPPTANAPTAQVSVRWLMCLPAQRRRLFL